MRSCAVLIATGVNTEGKRMILGVSVSMSEAEIHWREFLKSLKERGLHGVTMITSDDHSGLKAALNSVFQVRLGNDVKSISNGMPRNMCPKSTCGKLSQKRSGQSSMHPIKKKQNACGNLVSE